ncbi:hypothetical protein Vadar_016682 [Vaccinium darrowii]|nr:hypothetical protein Vadar_016682 [Vaccinium darrowii]
MTLKQSAKDDDSKDKRKSKEFYYEERVGGKRFGEMETDQESVGSSEETESPRSVTRIGRWTTAAAKKMAYVHSQILRIREEDSHIAENRYTESSIEETAADFQKEKMQKPPEIGSRS